MPRVYHIHAHSVMEGMHQHCREQQPTHAAAQIDQGATIRSPPRYKMSYITLVGVINYIQV